MQKLHLHLAILKTSFLANKEFARVPAKGMITRLLHLFLIEGIISSVEYSGTYYKVYFNYNFPFNSLVFVGPTKLKMWRKSDELRKLNAPFAFISTRQGILPLQDVRKLRLGGILLCKFAFTKV